MKKLFLIALALALSSCSHFHNSDSGLIQNRGTDYLKAKSIPPLKIPPGLSSSTISPYYPVIDSSYPNGTQPINLVPPELGPGK